MLAVQITCKNEEEAQKIADLLLEEKLIVCANMFPVKSAFLWKGKKESANEHVILAKTKKELFCDIEKEVKKIHSYEVPFISAWEEKTTADIEQWMNDELK